MLRHRATVGRPFPLIGVALAVALCLHVGAPPALACSCVGPQPMATYAAEPRTSVLTGIPGPLQPRGVPISVTGWYKGPGARPVVWLAASSFGDQSAACQREPPAVGRELVLVLYWPEDGSDPSGGICTPIAAVEGPEGQRMLADARASFGPPATPVATPGRVAGEAPLDALLGLAPAIGGIAAGAVLLVLVVGVLARPDRSRSVGTPGDGPP